MKARLSDLVLQLVSFTHIIPLALDNRSWSTRTFRVAKHVCTQASNGCNLNRGLIPISSFIFCPLYSLGHLNSPATFLFVSRTVFYIIRPNYRVYRSSGGVDRNKLEFRSTHVYITGVGRLIVNCAPAPHADFGPFAVHVKVFTGKLLQEDVYGGHTSSDETEPAFKNCPV
jgi:hypothetical protein